MTFSDPWNFLFLIPLIIAFAIRLISKPPTLMLSSIEYFTGKKSSKSIFLSFRQIPLILELAGIGLLIFAISRPQQGVEIIEKRKEGVDIIFALDLSNSMNTYDPEGNPSAAKVRKLVKEKKIINRLEEAKKQLAKFIERRPNDRIGYVIFGNEAWISCPPTLDHNYLQSQIEATKFELFYSNERGTNIAAALAASLSTLLNTKSKQKAIVLITDGRNSLEDEITPEEAAEIARNENIVIHTVGIGSKNPFFNNPLTGKIGKVTDCRMDIDVPQMKRIAKISGGQFLYAKDRKSFEEVMLKVDQLETSRFEQPSFVYFKELFQPWLLGGMALLFIGFFLQHSFLQRIP